MIFVALPKENCIYPTIKVADIKKHTYIQDINDQYFAPK